MRHRLLFTVLRMRQKFLNSFIELTNFSDGWVSCNQQGHKTMHYLRCDNTGRLYIGPNVPSMVGGVMDNTVTLPDCSR